MRENIEAIYSQIMGSLLTEHLLWKVALIIIALFVLFNLVRAWRNHYKRDWDSFYFVVLCAAIFIWALFTLLPFVLKAQKPQLANLLYTLRLVGAAFVPGVACLHVWRQLSYKNLGKATTTLFLSIPFILCAFPIAAVFGVDISAYSRWGVVVFYAYTAIMLVRAVLLCFNVFYQMPRHMRKSSYYLLAGVFACIIGFALHFVANHPLFEQLDFPLIGSSIMLLFFADAFRAAASANVIVTSRDFVFSNLSTMILVLSHKNRILDWNRKEITGPENLPEPLYKESFENYKKRMIREGQGQVSPHGDNIITTLRDNEERHYLITIHEVGQESRDLGFIAEIAEVTRLYTIIRYLEDTAVMDQLTGLFNRNAYLKYVQTSLQPENMPLLVLVGDVNNLKQLNDVHGHLHGDQLLTTVAQLIKESEPAGSFTARIGGDEFVLLLSGGSEETAVKFIQRVQKKSLEIKENFFGVPSISWGYAVMHNTKEDYNEVFARADEMMYADKKAHSRFRSSGLVPNPDTVATTPLPLPQAPDVSPAQEEPALLAPPVPVPPGLKEADAPGKPAENQETPPGEA